jgi:hypothetical protein
MEAIVIFFTQTLFVFLRAKDIDFVRDRQIIKGTLNQVFTSALWLGNVTYGVTRLQEGNLTVACAFIIGSVLGTFFALMTKRKIDKELKNE